LKKATRLAFAKATYELLTIITWARLSCGKISCKLSYNILKFRSSNFKNDHKKIICIASLGVKVVKVYFSSIMFLTNKLEWLPFMSLDRQVKHLWLETKIQKLDFAKSTYKPFTIITWARLSYGKISHNLLCYFLKFGSSNFKNDHKNYGITSLGVKVVKVYFSSIMFLTNKLEWLPFMSLNRQV
jgi:hypothetical protein